MDGPGAGDPWADVAAAATAVREQSGVECHDVAVVLGSGWAPAAERFGTTTAELDAGGLPGFVRTRVAGHSDALRSVQTAEGRRVLVLGGRVHPYEGHDLPAVVHPVRTAIAAGCRVVVLTNAAGGLREGMRIGQPVLIADHLNLTGRSCLAGPPAPADLGLQRFVDLTDAYAARLRVLAREVDPSLEDGVYAGVPGPHYETPAEIRMLQGMGADLVGMSTVHETIAARHAGAEVLGLCLVTNLAAGLGHEALNHADVLDAGQAAAEAMGDLLAAVVARL
ncbi:MAG: purine-nucleoside phosphorylase [Acidimicrobiales bacterium]|nr:purine-nucleoside phosphorylase [Acidimicrobiales bacterium]